MPIATREAEGVSEGALASGTWTLSSGSRALGTLPVIWARTERADGKTSPEELIAAAGRRTPSTGAARAMRIA